MFRERTLSRLKRRAPLGRLALLLWDAVPHPAKGAFLKKRPLEPSKTFFRGVKAKPDGLSVFRAGTLSRLKRREASPKTQGLSEDASHHARSTKHPQRGRRTVPIDRFPKINGSGIPDSSSFHKKYVARPQKKFSDRPLFPKGSPGTGREALQETPGAGQKPCKKRPERGCRMGSPAKEKNSCERMDKRRRHGSRKRKASPTFF